jgi:Glycosyl transferases group 1
MKILYYSDTYTWENFGTKRSLYLELMQQGNRVTWKDIADVGNIIVHSQKEHPDYIFLAHSDLIIPQGTKKYLNKIGIVIVGFGMSDPYYFTIDRLASYDIYITNHNDTYKYCRKILPCHYHRTACDFRFHGIDRLKKKKYLSTMIGIGVHPWFNNKNKRLEYVDFLRENDLVIDTFGDGWRKSCFAHKHIEGVQFRTVIQESKLGLDFQDKTSPLSHRMFEYAACGVPVIAKRRAEVLNCFKEDSEILLYENKQELLDKTKFYLKHTDKLIKIGFNAFRRCLKEHDIRNRTLDLIDFLNKEK